jgi:Ca2+-binding EF-hand superfamily protein
MTSIDRKRAVLAWAAGAAVCFAGAGFAQTSQDPVSRSPAATGAAADTKPITPSRAETVDSAFRKLDPAGRGYVSKEDIGQLSGFDQVFIQNDVNRDGRLSSDEFRKAWTIYSGYPQ